MALLRKEACICRFLSEVSYASWPPIETSYASSPLCRLTLQGGKYSALLPLQESLSAYPPYYYWRFCGKRPGAVHWVISDSVWVSESLKKERPARSGKGADAIRVHFIGSCSRSLLQIWMRHVSHMNESCLTCEWVISHVRILAQQAFLCQKCPGKIGLFCSCLCGSLQI